MLLSPTRGLPVWMLFGSLLVVLVPWLWLGRDTVSFEGPLFGQLIEAGVLVGQFVIALTLLQGLRLWWLLRSVLNGLEHHPMVAAFERVPASLLAHPVSPMPPMVSDLHLPVNHANRLVRGIEDVRPDSGEDADNGHRVALRRAVGADLVPGLVEAGRRVTAAVAGDRDGPPARVWSTTDTWAAIRELTGRLLPCMPRWWAGGALTFDTATTDEDRRRVTEWYERAEELLAIESAMAFREVLYRIVRMLAFAVVAQVIVLGTHVVFNSQQRQFNIWRDWAYLGIAIGVALYVFAQMDRQPVLCRVSSETDRTRWSRDFVLKIFLYGILPLLGVFAAYFPEVGGDLFRWVQRFQGPLL